MGNNEIEYDMGTSVEDDIQAMGRSQSDLSEGVQLLLNEKFKRRKTILKREKHISAITTLEVIAQVYDIDFLKHWIDWYCEFMTSSSGVGRKDIVDMFKFSHDQAEAKNVQLMEMLRGR